MAPITAVLPPGGRASGITSRQAAGLISKYGYNEIKVKKKNSYKLFLKKFYGPVQLLLMFVAAISFATGKPGDLYIIVALLVFNAIVGFLEEYRADKSVESLKSMLASEARVLRDGRWITIPARLLVPSDTIRVRLGDVVPADAVILECETLEIDESVLTGESSLVNKRTGDTAYQGSVIRLGEATCIVAGTGRNTKYGMTERLVQIASPASHLEGEILKLVKYLVAGDSVVVTLMFLYGVFLLHTPPITILPMLLVVLIASVPVALSAAFTVAMAVGTERLAKKSVLVTRLESTEDIATMEVLCTDKTGTLTQNIITIKEVLPYKCNEGILLKYAAEASRLEDNDPIDNAVLEYAASMRVKVGRQLSFSPFNPLTKRTIAEIVDRKKYSVAKGATLVILKLVHLNSAAERKVNAKINRFASKGFRSVAVAVRKGGGAWKLVGILALYDPPRPEIKELIDELRGLGISVKMMTGDSMPVAREISKEVGLGKRILMLKEKGTSIDSILVHADGFAGMYPADKYILVKALQAKGLIVGMTGDGVNDAPALKQAEVGIAVANATDIAKSSAAMVLTKNGLGVIIDAVKESRKIFERMVTYTTAKIAKVFQIVGFVAITYLLFRFMPITPFLLILLIFTNDIVNISISEDNANYSGKPDVWNIKSLIYSSGAVGILLVTEALIFIPIGLGILGLTIVQFQTMIFLMLNVTDKFTVLNMRERRWFWKSAPSVPLIAASAIGMVVGVAMAYFGILMPKIGPLPILLVFALSAAFLFLNDFVKRMAFKRFGIIAAGMQ